MQVLEKNLSEIQQKAGRMSDFLRMEYLESCAIKFNDSLILRYCYQELSRLYEGRKMYSDAIKYIFKYQETLVSEVEKMNAMMKEVELLIKAGFYDRADLLIKRIIENSKESQKFEVRRKIVEMFKQEAARFEKESKFTPLLKVYEKLIEYLADAEKNEIKRRMVIIYKKLGKVRESLELERQMDRSLV